MTIDWQRIALNIRCSGLSLQQASRQLGRNKGWLAQISRGEIQEPFFGDGLRLLDLHLDCVGIEKHREVILERVAPR